MRYYENFPEQSSGEKMPLLGEVPAIHSSCHIKDSKIGSWTALGAGYIHR